MITSKDIPNYSLIRNPPIGNINLQDDDDYIYYNAKIYNKNKTTLSIEAKFKERRLAPILNNPSNYELAIVRFNIPGAGIPLQIFKENFYLVTLSYNGIDEQVYLQWTPNSSPPLNEVRNFWEFVESTNTALLTAFNNLVASAGPLPVTIAPFMTYDGKTKLFNLYVEQTYSPSVVSPTVEIWFNLNLHLVYSGLQSFFNLNTIGKDFKILVNNRLINSVTISSIDYFIMESEFSTAFLIKDLQQIILETNEIPVSRELLPFDQSPESNPDVGRFVVTDFEPLITSAIIEREQFQFFPLGPLRYVSLKSKFPLKSIDINISYTNKAGDVFPILILPDQIATVKILFRKKRSIVFADELDQSESIQ